MTQDDSTDFQAARLVHVRIQPDRAVFDVVIDPLAPARTTPQLVQRAADLRPNLPQHTCVNAQSKNGRARPVFGLVMDDTPLPHLLEHLAIDVLTEHAMATDSAQADAQAGQDALAADPTFVGTSEWVDRAARTARIELSCPDDLVVLSAFAEALHLLNRIVLG